MARVDKVCCFVVNKVDGLICGDPGWQLGDIGLRVGCDLGMLSGGGVVDAADLRATGDNIDNPRKAARCDVVRCDKDLLKLLKLLAARELLDEVFHELGEEGDGTIRLDTKLLNMHASRRSQGIAAVNILCLYDVI